MKYLKWILGILLLLLILFLVNGLLNPSFSYDSEITVDKSIEESYAVMNDESKTSQWLKGIINMEHVSGQKGEVGAVTKYTFSENGQESIIVETLKEIRPNEYVAMDFEMEGAMDMAYEIMFSEESGKAKIKSKTKVIGKNIFMKSMFSLMKGTMVAQENENLKNLKKVIEENTTDYFPEPILEPVQEMEVSDK